MYWPFSPPVTLIIVLCEFFSQSSVLEDVCRKYSLFSDSTYFHLLFLVTHDTYHMSLILSTIEDSYLNNKFWKPLLPQAYDSIHKSTKCEKSVYNEFFSMLLLQPQLQKKISTSKACKKTFSEALVETYILDILKSNVQPCLIVTVKLHFSVTLTINMQIFFWTKIFKLIQLFHLFLFCSFYI